jgi:hypothetical protein
MPIIPPAMIGVTAPILDGTYTHAQLNSLFMSAGFPGDPPQGNKTQKCQDWMRAANSYFQAGSWPQIDPLELFGRLIAEFMDTPPAPPPYDWNRPADAAPPPDPRDRIREALAREGLSYARGGHILGAALTGPSRSLADKIKAQGTPAIEIEYDRAYKQVSTDPAAALTAACAILESVCKVYLESNGQPLPNKQVLGNLWPEVARHLGLSPKELADDDLKRILTGLFSIADGVAALRTHEGSAHGREGKRTYNLAPRHARLAVHAAHTMAMFVLETWEARRS